MEPLNSTDRAAGIPFVDFLDVDQNGMIDMVFYYDKAMFMF